MIAATDAFSGFLGGLLGLFIFACLIMLAIGWITFPFLILERFKKLQKTADKQLEHLAAMRKYYEPQPPPLTLNEADIAQPKRESLR